MALMYQCRFEQETPDGIITEVAWVEEKGSRVGSLVELKGKDGLWRVVFNSGSPMDSSKLAEKQAADRRQRSGSDI
jgi:hypothetical protein